VLEAAGPPELSALPAVRGPLVRLGELTGLVGERGRWQPLWLLPDEEPPLLAPAVGRVWAGGPLLFEALDFESEAEEAARRALEDGRGLRGGRGLPSRLRLAFALTAVEAASRRLGIACSAAEAAPRLEAVAEAGLAAAEALLRHLEAERRLVEEELAHQRAARRTQHHAEAVATARRERTPATPERVERALAQAGAQLLRSRALGEGLLEVTFRLRGERFITLVDAATLQVRDAGICLGHPPADEALNLDSLPGVIEEAMDDGVLVVTRHA
jgi:hypothetical protein